MNNHRFDFSKIAPPDKFHIGGWSLLLGCAIVLWFTLEDVFPQTVKTYRGIMVIGAVATSLLIGITCYGLGFGKKLANVLVFACTVLMCVNVASHLLMARALNVAYVGEIQTREENLEEDRRKDADAKREVDKLNAASGYIRTVAAADNAALKLYNQTGVKPQARRSNLAVVVPTPAPTVTPTPASVPNAFGKTEVIAKRETRTDVFQSWAQFCSILAILDLLLPVGGFGLCLMFLEIDWNRDGIADRKQSKT